MSPRGAARRGGSSRGAGAAGGRPLLNWIAGGLVCAVVVTVAIVANGFDARETPREEPSVWAMRSTGQYARVNTETAEIDTVRTVDEPSDVVQDGADGVVLSHGDGRAWGIDPMAPADLTESETEGAAEQSQAASPTAVGTGTDEEGPMRTPEGTRETVSAGDAVVFRTEAGEVFLSTLEASGSRAMLSPPQALDPLDDAGGADGESTDGSSDTGAGSGGTAAYAADAVAVAPDGRIAMYSGAEHAVRWYDAARSEFVGGADPVPEEVTAESLQMTIVGDDWVLLDAESGTLWRKGVDEGAPVDVDGAALLQQAGGEPGSDVLIADAAGLWGVTRDGAAERLLEAEGTPARPIALDDTVYAGWLGQDGGTLWSSEGGETPLEIDGAAGDRGEPEPVFRSNGSRALLSDVRTGMMWTVPDGELIPVEQWSLVDPPKEEQGTVVVEDVTEQEPPVAVDDEFGVRPGEPAPLPVLLNDYDPNRRDVLTIVPEGLGKGMPESFGRVAMLSDGQGLTFTPSADASGTETFTYRVTDGSAVSEPATVTVRAVTDDSNSAPEWCPVEGCQREWPSPELAPGGTLVLPLLEGWVDPQGDPMTLQSAEAVNADDPVRAVVTADGRLAVRHLDPNAGEGEIGVRVEVADARGETRTRELQIRMRPGALAELAPIASTVKTGETTTLRPLTRVTGGSGSFALVDAVPQGDGLDVTANQGEGSLRVSAEDEGSTVVSLTVRDLGTEAETTGTLRVTAVDSRSDLALPPLTAFVRGLADTTVEVLDAVPGASDRALSVRGAEVVDGEMSADVIEHARVRVSGGTADGGPGRVGAADVTVSEEGATATGRLTVFQVADEASSGAIAVADTATVRAGSIVDIPVLDNDVSPPGERLVLHPDVGAPGAKGELAFASGNRLRYLAPSKPGTYTLTYTTYGASSPEASDVGRVRVTVVPREGNRDPQPAAVTLRVAPGETASSQVPLSGVDPDGDRVRLTSVGTPDDALVGASLSPRNSSVQVDAASGADPGTYFGTYTVRDEFGGEGTGRVRVIVTDGAQSAGAPVVYSDYVRLTKGVREPATVRPLQNDLDPAGGALELVEVVPNVPGTSAAEVRRMQERIDTSQLKKGVVRIEGGDELGTVSYRYTVRSKETKSTADGLIVVQVSERVGQQAPVVRDTVLSVRDRAELSGGGVDVVTDRVYWATGDVSSLKLSLWGSASERYSVQGNRIIGSYRAEGDLVPFKLSGRDAMGEEVQTFGFLVVPPLDELRLTLKPGFRSIVVDEGESRSVDIDDIVDLGADDRAELREGRFPVQRGQAGCEATGSGQLRYTAGEGGPWNDSCVVSVKLSEQRAWTRLPVPVQIVPDEPIAKLEGLTRTVAPGQTETIDLAEMVRWEGGREGSLDDLRLQASGGGRHFEVEQTGTKLRVQARADAPSGNQEALTVTSAGAGESRAPLALRVGVAPRDVPRGATVALDCTVGSRCQTDVVGAPGEYDPFAGKSGGGLDLVSVDDGGCRFGDFSASGDSVVVSWSDSKGPGGQCTASFTVEDAQGRTGTGKIELDAQGVPRAPAGISAVGYDASSVTLEVRLSDRAAHPAVTDVVVYQDGRRSGAGCSASGATYRCVVGGLSAGEKHDFTARAVNAVGESDPTSNAVRAWAYERPAAPRVTARQTSAESPGTGTVSFSVEGSRGTSGYRLSVNGGSARTLSGRDASATVPGVAVGDATYSVVPLSSHDVPPGDSAEGAAASGTVRVTGLPEVKLSLSSDPGSSRVTASVTMSSGGDAGQASVSAGPGGSCRDTREGTSGSFSFDGQRHKELRVTACGENRWGAAAQVSEVIKVGGEPRAPRVDAGYEIGARNTTQATRVDYELLRGPSVALTTDGAELQYRVDGGRPTRDFAPPTTAGQEAQVRQCTDTGDAGTCSDWVALPAEGMPATGFVELTGACVSEDAPGDAVRVSDSLASLQPAITANGGSVVVDWRNGRGTATLTGGTACPADDGTDAPPDGP